MTKLFLLGEDKTVKLDTYLSDTYRCRGIYQTMKNTLFAGDFYLEIDDLVEWTKRQVAEYPSDTQLSFMCTSRLLGDLPQSLDDFCILPTEIGRPLSRLSRRSDTMIFAFHTDLDKWRASFDGSCYFSLDTEMEAHRIGCEKLVRRLELEFFPSCGKTAREHLAEIIEYIRFCLDNEIEWRPVSTTSHRKIYK